MNKLTVTTDSNNQFSAFLLDHLLPINLRKDWDNDLKINFYIKPLIQTIKLIIDLGELEHSHDWDPNLRIVLFDETQSDGFSIIETTNGYYTMVIDNDKLIIEDENQESDIFYDDTHTILIKDIHSIEFIR